MHKFASEEETSDEQITDGDTVDGNEGFYGSDAGVERAGNVGDGHDDGYEADVEDNITN
jgi:hypothetical protein